MNSSNLVVCPDGSISYEEALNRLDEVINSLFAFDPRIQSVGITRFKDGFGFRATRNKRIILPQSSSGSPPKLLVPIVYVDVPDIVRPLKNSPNTPVGGSSNFLERNAHRPLVCGLQIQNLDFDTRVGNVGIGRITIGSIGCFVKTGGTSGLLSNNHILAGENNGQKGDRIVQPAAIAAADPHIGELHAFVPLDFSSPNAQPALGNVSWNEVDAAVAFLTDGIDYHQRYLPHHNLPPIAGTGSAETKEEVFKVGQASAVTRGLVVATPTVVECKYDGGVCWFRNSIEIEGLNGEPFSQHGDSGAVVVNHAGEVVGVLYSGNGITSFACPISSVMEALDCTIQKPER